MNLLRKYVLLLPIVIVMYGFVSSSPALSQAGKLSISPSDPLQPEVKKALKYYYNSDWGKAEAAFSAIVQQYPTYATAYIYLADTQSQRDKPEAAMVNYDKAYALLEQKLENRKLKLPALTNPSIYADMIYCLNALGRYETAKQIGLWGTVEGEHPDVFINLGYTFHKLGRDDLAQKNYCKARTLAKNREISNLYQKRINEVLVSSSAWQVICPDDRLQSSGTNYALLIGVGTYKDPAINALKYVENDIRELYEVLTDPGTGIFLPKNIMTLINEEATEKNIKFRFDDMVAKATHENDMVLVFYAGHGFSYPNGKDTYWLTYDTEVGDETGNRIKSTAFSNLMLASKISDIKAGNFLFFIDACYSAGMVERQAAIRGLDSYLGIGKDYTIITSSKADQLSIESPKLKHGLFSYALISGLSGKADLNTDGIVEIDELWPYMRADISMRAGRMGGEQNPVRSGSSGGLLQVSKNPNY